MTLTEIEDAAIARLLKSVSGPPDETSLEDYTSYLQFLQAAEIRRRLVGWQDPEIPYETQTVKP